MNKQQFTKNIENTLDIISRLTINHNLLLREIQSNKIILNKLEDVSEDLQEFHGIEPKYEFFNYFSQLEDQITHLIRNLNIKCPNYTQEVIDLFGDLIKTLQQLKWEMLHKTNPIEFTKILLKSEIDNIQKPFVEYLCKRTNMTGEGLISFLKKQQKRVHSIYSNGESMVVYDSVITVNIKTAETSKDSLI